MVVKFIGTSITSLAVLCVDEYVCIAQIAVETILVWVEVNQGHLVFLCCAYKAFQGYSRVCWVAYGRLHCGYNHNEKADEVERQYHIAEDLVYCSNVAIWVFHHQQAYRTKEEAYEDEGSYYP